nr:MAG TPA: hypothetical protein [Caudoviricetes sp.]
MSILILDIYPIFYGHLFYCFSYIYSLFVKLSSTHFTTHFLHTYFIKL